ncbi:tyrosine-type recombinase/integrase [Escherichia coli]|uniref:tyrosine-type recombinase/integrase n=1 Tax=Escherichia coli TaxID=562 RepID=UPI003904B284
MKEKVFFLVRRFCFFWKVLAVFIICVLHCVLQKRVINHMALNKLSDKKLRSLLGRRSERQETIADGNGLSVRVSKYGCVSFVFFYRLAGRGTAPIWLTLGKYPDLSLKSAREMRDQCRTWLAEGRDPRIQIKIEREATLQPVTVREALEYWLDNYAMDKRRGAEHIRQCFGKHIYPVIGHVPLSDCSISMWIKCFDKIKKVASVQAGALLRISKQALKFCRVRKYAISHEIDDLEVCDVGKKSARRSRVLTDDEIRDLWRSINTDYDNHELSYENRIILRFLVVFGCRLSEVLLSSWVEWDFDKKLWRVPADHSKNGREIIRPIPDGMFNWLVTLKKITGNKENVIGFDMRQCTASVTIGKTWKRMKHSEKWTAHDMRRVFATKLSDHGFEHNVVEQLLGHTLGGVAGVYNRSQYMDRKKEAMNWWYDYLNKQISGDSNDSNSYA